MNFEENQISALPEEIGQLVHLEFMDLGVVSIKTLSAHRLHFTPTKFEVKSEEYAFGYNWNKVKDMKNDVASLIKLSLSFHNNSDHLLFSLVGLKCIKNK